MGKIYLRKKYFFITMLFVVIAMNAAFAQTSKGKTTTASTTKTPPAKPVNIKNIKARGIIAADMDCTVKVNNSAKPVNVKAYTASIVMLQYGVNTIAATSTDAKSPAYYNTTINVTDTTKQIIEISFYDDKRFLDYVKTGKVDMVETAIKKNPALANNDGDILSSSPLQTAIVCSQPEVVKLLVNKGASFNTPDYFYPLFKATVYASGIKVKKDKDTTKSIAPDREMIEFFLTKGCKLTEKDDGGNTLLHAACRAVKLDLVKYYVKNGLDINAKNSFGDTPIIIAEQKGAISIINYLRSKGATEDKIPDSLEPADSTSEGK